MLVDVVIFIIVIIADVVQDTIDSVQEKCTVFQDFDPEPEHHRSFCS